MTRQILNRWNGAVIWSGEAETMQDAVREAIKASANLRGADLRDANLYGANLGGADLTPVRDDVWAVLSGAPAEVPTLIAKLKAGEVDGSCYGGPCACLVGTIANARGCAYTELGRGVAAELESSGGSLLCGDSSGRHSGDESGQRAGGAVV